MPEACASFHKVMRGNITTRTTVDRSSITIQVQFHLDFKVRGSKYTLALQIVSRGFKDIFGSFKKFSETFSLASSLHLIEQLNYIRILVKVLEQSVVRI